MRLRGLLLGLVLCSCAVGASAQILPGALPATEAALQRGEWPVYAGSNAALRWSPLDIVDRSNAGRLRVVWRWRSPDHDLRQAGLKVAPAFSNESTPIMIGRTLYTSTSLSQVAAIDAVTGTTKWVHDTRAYAYGIHPPNLGWNNMGVAFWRSGDDERVIILTAYGFMVALDARTGEPVESFGEKGRIDLTHGLRREVNRADYTSQAPPMIVGDVIVVGSSVYDFWLNRPSPPGDVRGFDVRSGKLLWTFHTVPQEEEAGVETWLEESWKLAGNTNVWAPMSADDQLGYVYLPVSTPSNDYYGGHRPGDGLYGESLVCLEAPTGRKVWHYQIVRHGLWDYDLPAAPNLLDIVVDGKPVKAVMQVTKQGFLFAFDRVTGKPIWPIEDRAVPPSSMPRERASATQPFPTRPAPFELQGVREDDLIDLTPALRADAIRVIQSYEHGPLYTPPTERGTIINPGIAGGANWNGAAVDPASGLIYVGSMRSPVVVFLGRPRPFEQAYDFIGRVRPLAGSFGLPLLKPPWSSLTAIDMNSGEHRWRIAVGTGPVKHPELAALDIKEPLGTPYARSWALVTKSLLFVVQAGAFVNARPGPDPRRVIYDIAQRDTVLWVHDKASGERLVEIPVGANAAGAPMTYSIDGRQFIVFPVGGGDITEELVAVSLD